MSASLQQSFTLAIQGILTGVNYRNTTLTSNIGLPVQNSYDKQLFSLSPGSSKNLKASQMIVIISDNPVQLEISPDVTANVPTPGSATIAQGQMFALTGSFLTSGVTVSVPTTASAANVTAVLVS